MTGSSRTITRNNDSSVRNTRVRHQDRTTHAAHTRSHHQEQLWIDAEQLKGYPERVEIDAEHLKIDAARLTRPRREPEIGSWLVQVQRS